MISVKALLNRAYDSYFEVIGPNWIESVVVQVDATMPPETTNEQFREMLRNLIADRFKLKFHEEARNIAGYALVVAKGGPKMKVSADTEVSQPGEVAPQTPREIDSDGFPVRPNAPGRFQGSRQCRVSVLA